MRTFTSLRSSGAGERRLFGSDAERLLDGEAVEDDVELGLLAQLFDGGGQRHVFELDGDRLVEFLAELLDRAEAGVLGVGGRRRGRERRGAEGEGQNGPGGEHPPAEGCHAHAFDSSYRRGTTGAAADRLNTPIQPTFVLLAFRKSETFSAPCP